MATFLAILFFLALGAIVYAIKRSIYRGLDNVENAIRNKRIDRDRAAGNTGTTESLADRYN